jgi:hypothetical protein
VEPFADPAAQTAPAHHALGNHPVDGAVVIAQFAQGIARMFADPGSRSANCGLVDFETGCGLGLPNPPDLRLI